MTLRMLEGVHPVWQTCMGTLLTWGLTALGAALVYVLHGEQRRILDGSLGFAAGVMLAASYWSLLAPATELAEESGVYGSFAFVPVAIGFLAGAFCVWIADKLLNMTNVYNALLTNSHKQTDDDEVYSPQTGTSSASEDGWGGSSSVSNVDNVRKRIVKDDKELEANLLVDGPGYSNSVAMSKQSWKRILLLVIAITVHNIPEGLAVGVGFGAIGKTPSATLESARNLAIGIGIQNFPEGLAVSLPLKAAGMSKLKSFWYGQLSGMVEPFAGIFGTVMIVIAEPLLPYALAFAAGAMIYVVVDDLIPESHTSGNGRLSSFCVVVGFLVMMSLDIGLG